MNRKERSENRQMAINLGASFITFAVNLCITFFLTPYIVKTLGSEAYGFIKLSTDIIGYYSLITIALNSMAGRFITIAYTSGDIIKANRYFSSVFFTNLILSVIIFVLSFGCVIFIEKIVKIPSNLIFDVKLLFFILSVNNIIGLIFGTWNVAAFIKNRLDISNVRKIVGNLIYAIVILTCFFFFIPKIWYVGVAGFAMIAYTSFADFQIARFLTPDLSVKRKFYEWGMIKELLSSGIWNLVNRINGILEFGLDLLIANWFLGATYMGLFALTKNIPFVILSLAQMIAAVFAPVLTQLYAVNKKDELIEQAKKSIRVLGFFSTIPIACLWIWGADFYSLWLPGENPIILQTITILSTLVFIVAIPMESLWNIFTITNKLKYSTLTMLLSSVIVLGVIMLSMYITDSELIRLYILAATRSIVGIVRTIIFLPIYGAYCLSQPLYIFYKPFLKSVMCSIIVVSLVYVLHHFIKVDSWWGLITACVLTASISVIINYFGILLKQERMFVRNKLRNFF